MIAIRSLADYEKLLKISRADGEAISISKRGEGKFHIYDRIQMKLSIYDTFVGEDAGCI